MNGKILVTGVTGNIGYFTAKYLQECGAEVLGAVTNLEKAKNLDLNMECIQFDFLNSRTYSAALTGVDRIFLIRPPILSDPKQMYPFLDEAKRLGVKHIVFISLLGIERNPFPPHYKIEKFIESSGIPYTFLRPSFFMQNLNTTHQLDIKEKGDIFLPAGDASVSFIDTRDIGEAAARILVNPQNHMNKGYTLTGPEALTYQDAAAIMTRILGRHITYSKPGVLAFRREMLKQGHAKGFVNVMAILYLTTRFGMAKRVTDDLATLIQREPTTLEQYVIDHAQYWD